MSQFSKLKLTLIDECNDFIFRRKLLRFDLDLDSIWKYLCVRLFNNNYDSCDVNDHFKGNIVSCIKIIIYKRRKYFLGKKTLKKVSLVIVIRNSKFYLHFKITFSFERHVTNHKMYVKKLFSKTTFFSKKKRLIINIG